LHIWSAFKLRAENRRRPAVGYAGDRRHLSPAMLAHHHDERLIIAAFVIFHLLHYALAVRAVNLTALISARCATPPAGRTFI